DVELLLDEVAEPLAQQVAHDSGEVVAVAQMRQGVAAAVGNRRRVVQHLFLQPRRHRMVDEGEIVWIVPQLRRGDGGFVEHGERGVAVPHGGLLPRGRRPIASAACVGPGSGMGGRYVSASRRRVDLDQCGIPLVAGCGRTAPPRRDRREHGPRVLMLPGMPDPTRDVAFDLLTAVLDRHRALDDALDALPRAEARDRAAGHRIAASVLRRLGTLNAVLEPFLRRAPPDPVRHVLRIGAASLLLLDTPPHAAVATAVALARSRGLAPFAGLVNAVLRRVSAQGPSALDGLDGPRLDTPAWLWSAWGRDARTIAEAHQAEAPLDLTLRPDAPAPPDAVILPTGTARLPAGTRVPDLPGFAEGAFWVQDAAAALPARLLAVRPGERVADLCAAPGGKTAQLAAAGASVVAVERDGNRAVRLRENLARLRDRK